MTDPNRARGRSREGLSVDFKGLRLYDDYGNVEYQQQPASSTRKAESEHRGRTDRPASPIRGRTNDQYSHRSRQEHGRYRTMHPIIDKDSKHRSQSKYRDQPKHSHRHSTDGVPPARRERRYSTEVLTEKPRHHAYDHREAGNHRAAHSLTHKRSMSMDDASRGAQQRRHHRDHQYEGIIASPARHRHRHQSEEAIDSASRHHGHHHRDGTIRSSSRHQRSRSINQPCYDAEPHDHGHRSHRRSGSTNEEPRSVYIPVTQTMYDVRGEIAGTGKSIKDVYAAGNYIKDDRTMYYHGDLDKWLPHLPAGPTRVKEKGKHARHRSVERLMDIGGKVYNKVKQHVEAGTEELARGWSKSNTNLTDAEKTAIRQAEKDERWAEAVRRHEKVARRSHGWDECFGDT